MAVPPPDISLFSILTGHIPANLDASAQVALVAAVAAIVSALAAVAATIISPVISFWTARAQIRASLISANRQAWINALRDDLAELFELLTWLFLLRPGTHSGEDGYRYVAERRSRIRLLKNRVRLRLNATEPASEALLSTIETLHSLAHAGDTSDESEAQFGEGMQNAVNQAQAILKSEWKRVKQGR
ncbi:MAG TPA: hypothetical protein VII56_01140 [Rhizomicrobium sp.]